VIASLTGWDRSLPQTARVVLERLGNLVELRRERAKPQRFFFVVVVG
jgi:hypothetical protein